MRPREAVAETATASYGSLAEAGDQVVRYTEKLIVSV